MMKSACSCGFWSVCAMVMMVGGGGMSSFLSCLCVFQGL